MASFSFTESAEEDLADIVRFTVKTWNVAQATRYIDGLERQAELIATNPSIGKLCADLAPDLRAFAYERHILYYLTGQDGIIVVRVLHQNMDAALHFYAEGDDN